MDSEKLRMLEPRNVWSIFEEITKIPRCSGKENKIQDWLNKWAEKNHINYRKDAVGNVMCELAVADPGVPAQPGGLGARSAQAAPGDFARLED